MMEDPSQDITEEIRVTDTEVEMVVSLGGAERNRRTMVVGKEVDEAGYDERMSKVWHHGKGYVT